MDDLIRMSAVSCDLCHESIQEESDPKESEHFVGLRTDFSLHKMDGLQRNDIFVLKKNGFNKNYVFQVCFHNKVSWLMCEQNRSDRGFGPATWD